MSLRCLQDFASIKPGHVRAKQAALSIQNNLSLHISFGQCSACALTCGLLYTHRPNLRMPACHCPVMLVLQLLFSSQPQTSGGQHTARRVQQGLRVLLLLLRGPASRLRPAPGWGLTASPRQRRGQLPELPGELTHPTVHLLPHLQSAPQP